MASIPKVKVTFDADLDGLKKGTSEAEKSVSTFGDKVSKFGKVAATAFATAAAAAVAYAGKLAIDGVKSAIADEAAQTKLANTLRNVTGATNSQIAATESYITKTQLAYGVTDTQLRPSLERLTRATQDVEQAQRLQQLALDISAGSGKSLESVSNALGKAYEGNTTALSKLGVGLSAAQLKTFTFDEITKKLADTFENQASAKADTFQGKLARLQQAFDEGKETVGVFILNAITPLVTLIVEKVVPAIQAFADKIGTTLGGATKGYADYVQNTLIPVLKGIWAFISDYLVPILANVLVPVWNALLAGVQKVTSAFKDNEDELTPLYNLFRSVANFIRDYVAPAFGSVLSAAINVISSAFSGLVTGIGRVVSIFDTVIGKIKDFINLVKSNPIVSGISGLLDNVFGGFRAAGGSVVGGSSYIVGERGPELFTPNASGMIIPNSALGSGNGTVINLTVNGAIDPEGVARSIINVLNNSSYRGTLGAGALV